MTDYKGTVLLSFDVEEFDLPLEYGQPVSGARQMQTGYDGFRAIMNILDSFNVPATFFTTANFAEHYRPEIQNISLHHEIASHAYYHSGFEVAHLMQSKKKLEEIFDRTVKGLRMPRMRAVDMNQVKAAGYTYDSSINPTWVPGRYNNLKLPRTIYHEDGMLRLPASVSPVLRVPLFWLSFKNLPYFLFRFLVKQTIKKDGYACLYFHPWEFVDLSDYKIPWHTRRLAGRALQERLARLINDLKSEYQFSTIEHYLQSEKLIS